MDRTARARKITRIDVGNTPDKEDSASAIDGRDPAGAEAQAEQPGSSGDPWQDLASALGSTISAFGGVVASLPRSGASGVTAVTDVVGREVRSVGTSIGDLVDIVRGSIGPMPETTTDDASPTDSVERAHADIARELFASITRGDLVGVQRLLAPSAVWHAPRLGGLGGERAGISAIAGFAASMFKRTNGTYAAELLDVAAGAGHGVVIHRTTARRKGRADDRRLDQLESTILRIERGRVVEAWGPLSTDPEAATAFWA